jgi:hypothetical protein
VTRKWAEHHHPLWYQSIVEKERAQQAAAGEQAPAEAAVAAEEPSERS